MFQASDPHTQGPQGFGQRIEIRQRRNEMDTGSMSTVLATGNDDSGFGGRVDNLTQLIGGLGRDEMH
jgi:hypothetical protein